MKRYPAGPITPHGAWHLRRGRIPNLQLTAYDESIRFDLMGGKAIPHRTAPEVVVVKKGGLKGLIPPWETIDQKGATEDGVTFLDALYDPIEVDMTVVAKGRDPQHLRRVVRELIGSIDVKQTSRLSFFDQDSGHWWSDVRWFKTPPDTMAVGESRSQELQLVLRADHGFWQSEQDVSQFRFTYDSARDNFNYTADLDVSNADWDVAYSGSGGGYARVNGKQLVWVDDPNDPILTNGRTGVLRRKNSTTTTDNQVVEARLGTFPEWSFPDNAYTQLWARMAEAGTPGDTGICLSFGVGWIKLSSWVGGVETVLRQRPLLIPPLKDEVFTLVAGYEGNPRLFKVLRNGFEIMSVKESGTGSAMGPGFRAQGLGLHAGAAILTQATPAGVTRWSSGDNTTVAQSGWLECLNIGDQPMYRDFTLFGPGTFRISDGPGSTEMIEFGPLLPNQVVYLRTDPRRRAVQDLTSIPPTQQELTVWQKAIKDFVSFATGNNVPPLLQEIESWFGIRPPQGNLYSLLDGRFSTGSAIPAKSPGAPAKPYFIKAEIDDGNADSKIICAGTPLRRYPV